MTAAALNMETGQNTPKTIGTPDEANRLIGDVDDALKKVSKQRADLGAYQNRFEMAVKGVDIAAENMQASESVIRDTDMAAEMVGFTKNQILMQAGTAMLAQANTKSQTTLRLLG
jgi:flagellin